MAATKIWGQFSADERAVLRKALHRRAKELSPEERELTRRYWRLMRDRSSNREADQADARVKPEYREWLKANGLPLQPYDGRRYEAWRRGVDRWTR